MSPQHHVPAERWFWIPAAVWWTSVILIIIKMITSVLMTYFSCPSFHILFYLREIISRWISITVSCWYVCHRAAPCFVLVLHLWCHDSSVDMSHDVIQSCVTCGHHIRTQTSCLSVRVSFTKSCLCFNWSVCCVRSWALLIKFNRKLREQTLNELSFYFYLGFFIFNNYMLSECLPLCL